MLTFSSSLLLSKDVKIRIYKTIILRVVLYVCKTWSLTLREEHRLRVFGPKRDEVIGGWRKLHNEFHNLYGSPSLIRITKLRRVRWMWNVAGLGEKRNACSVW
jgi:hypothetical protein